MVCYSNNMTSSLRDIRSPIQRVLVIVLALVLACHGVSCADGTYGFQRFRYYSLVPEYDATEFYIDDTIRLVRTIDKANAHENDGSVSVTIDQGQHCTTSTRSSSMIDITCTSGGSKRLKVTYSTDTSGNDDYFWIDIIPRKRCGAWYVSQYNVADEILVDGPASSGFGTGTLSIWAVPIPVSDETELAGNATSPSAKSAKFTEGLYTMGVVPAVEQEGLSGIGTVAWDSTNKVWSVTYNYTSSGAASLLLYDSNHGGSSYCFLSNKTTELSIRQVSSYTLSGSTPDTLGAFVYRANPCSPNIALGRVTTSTFKDVFYTQSAWRYYSTGILYSSAKVGGSTTIRDAWPMQETNLVLTEQGLYYYTDPSSTTFTAATGLTSTLSSGKMSVAQACDELLQHDLSPAAINSYVMVWQATTGGTVLYYSSNNGTSFTSVTIDTTATTSMTTGTINQAMAMHRQPFFTLLVYFTAPSQSCLIYNTDSSSWKMGQTFGSDMGSSANFVMARSGTGALFIFGNQLLYYSVDGCQSAMSITISMRDTTNGPLESGETLDEVVSSTTGYYAVRTSKNKILVGREGLNEVKDVQSGYTDNNAYMSMGFDASGRFYEVIATSATAMSRTHWPIGKIELRTQREPASANILETCPYVFFRTDQDELSYIDVWSYYLINTTVSSNATVPVTTTAAITNPLKLNVSLYSNSIVVEDGIVNNTRSLKFLGNDLSSQYNTSATLRESFEQGSIAVMVKPHNVTFACDTVQKVSSLRVGCPPNSYLKLISTSPATCSDFYSGYTFTLSKKDHNSDMSGSQPWYSWFESDSTTITYDYDTYGCPENVFWGTTSGYAPIFELYENGEYVRNITSDVVLYEVNGRFDWYMASNPPSKTCTSAISTRAEAVEHAEACADEVIGYAYDSTGLEGTNQILFSASGDGGIYQFHAWVANYSASYCDLNVRFSIRAFGAPLKFYWTLMVVGIVILCFVLFCLISFCYYRWRVVNHKKKEKLA